MLGNRFGQQALQTVFETIYPPQCLGCGVMVTENAGLCGACWSDTHFISGLVCHKCGLPLPGEDLGNEELCDDCLKTARPWLRGRAVLVYKGAGRKLVLRLKHADRSEIVDPAARWMARQTKDLVTSKTVVAPIPLHWRRYFRRRYNQSSLLAGSLANLLDRPCVHDLLTRTKATTSLDGKTRDERFEVLNQSISATQRNKGKIRGADILLVDDVMTSGATFAAATEACYVAGANSVCIVALARVIKDA